MSERTTIAEGVDGEGQVWQAHFGMAPWYYLFDRQGELVERRANPYARSSKHHDDPMRIAVLMPGCGTLIARRMGEQSRRRLAESLGVRPVLTEATDPHQAVQAYLEGQGD
jgi:predicted Fe-Mo cluster-binding NifX family protein